MEGESTSLRAELQVIFDDPANFYNIVMSNSGKPGAHEGWAGLARLLRSSRLRASVAIKTTLCFLRYDLT